MSLAGGAVVANACRSLGYQVVIADISPDELDPLEMDVDVVFPVLHGEFGEDGTLQELLETRGRPYVGSGPTASRNAMNKVISKSIWAQAGLPTAPWIAFDGPPCGDAVLSFELPAVVKPVRQGSSIGIAFTETFSELRDAVTDGVLKWGTVLVEPRLRGPELTVGIIGGEPLPIIEIRTPRAFYDYQAKYLDTDTSYHFETGFSSKDSYEIQDLALAAFKMLGCRDMGRVDLIVDQIRGPSLLEINTIPGFTEHSLLPKAAAQAGLALPQLVESLVAMAVARAA